MSTYLVYGYLAGRADRRYLVRAGNPVAAQRAVHQADPEVTVGAATELSDAAVGNIVAGGYTLIWNSKPYLEGKPLLLD